MLTDVAALSLTLGAIWFASRPPTAKKTFGYYRLEILAAFVNGIALVLLSIWVIVEAAGRWNSPPPVDGVRLTAIAAGGLIVNIVAAKLLHSDHKHDLNIRGAYLHVIGDLLGSVAAILAGVLILAFGWLWADPLCSILISLIIIFGAWRPFGTFAAALLFGFCTALAYRLPVYSDSAATLFQTLPYILTLIAVCGVVGRTVPPAADGKPYVRQ